MLPCVGCQPHTFLMMMTSQNPTVENEVQLTHTPVPDERAITTPQHLDTTNTSRGSPFEGVVTNFTMNPHVIPTEEDELLLKSNQALLMTYCVTLGHCSFTQLKELVLKGIIQKKLLKVPPAKCPSC